MKEDELTKKFIEYETTIKKHAEVVNTLNINQQLLIKKIGEMEKNLEPKPKEEEKKEEKKDGETK